eukprot:m.251171 g.251171  ORF g.251171 m.251171 type:complete len:185 (+) comp17097_c0_seq1:27-581(+)
MDIAALLECLLGAQTPDMLLPKYAYPSAGSLYPVQTYIYVKEGAAANIESGTYYYHPREHKLNQYSVNVPLPRSVFVDRVAQDKFDRAGVVLFLISQLSAIEPLYPEKAREFSYLEAGYMVRVVEERAAELKIACDVLTGDVTMAPLTALFDLESTHLYTLAIGLGGTLPLRPLDPPAEPVTLA